MSARYFPFLFAPLFFAVSISFAGNGKISGRVVRSDGAGIPANIILRGSERGTTADTAGRYILIDITPGTYDVTASAVGFHQTTVKDVRLSADETVNLNFQLQPGEISMSEILIEGRESVVDKTRTSAKTTFDADEVERLPVSGLAELMSTAPGVYGPFIRGARQYDSRVYVDGVDVTDRSAPWAAERNPFSNSYFLQNTMHVEEANTQAFISPSSYAVGQATVYAGMVGADYGTAPGVITYALREGNGPWHGRLQFRVSQLGGLQHGGPSVYNDAAAYFATRDQLLRSPDPSSRNKAGSFTWSPGKYSYGGAPTYNVEFGVGGSIAEWMGAYVSGGWFDSHGRLPNEWTRKANATAKLTFPLSTALRFDVVGILQDRGQLLGWKNRAYEDWYRFFLEGVPLWDGMSATGSIKLTHFLSPSSFYELQVSYSHDNNRRGFCDDNQDGVVSPWEDGDYLTWEDSKQVSRYFGGVLSSNFGLFFSVPGDASANYVTEPGLTYKLTHPIFLYEVYTHRTMNVRGTFNSQFLSHHELSVGGEIRQHRIDKCNRTTQWGGNFGRPFFEEQWSRKPKEFSGFVQDRMEYNGLNATIGIRVDAYDYDAADIADYFAPITDGTNASGLPDRIHVRGNPIPLRAYVSPRLSIGVPTTDNSVLYVSVSRTFSPLPYSILYCNYDSRREWEALSRIDQEPLITTTYDLGFHWILSDGFGGSLGMYYRDMANYSFMRVQPIVDGINYLVISRAGFADTRGVEASIDYRREHSGFLNGLHARLAYTYSTFNIAKNVNRNQWQYTASDCSTLGIAGQLPFGDMQFWARTYGRDYSGQSPMLSGFDRTHRFALSIAMPLPYGFHLGCVGTFASGFYYPEIFNANPAFDEAYTGEYGVGYKEGPWNKRVDIRLEKVLDFPGVGTLSVFADVINCFNWSNILTYFATNDMTFKAWANHGDPTGGPGVNQPATVEGSLIYGVPREVYFGVGFAF